MGRIDARTIISTTFKATVVSLLMGLIVFVLARLLEFSLGSGKAGSLGVLICGSLAGMVFYAIATKIMKMEEYEMAMDMLRRRKKGTTEKEPHEETKRTININDRKNMLLLSGQCFICYN